ncbi:hypothetical protein GCM10022243_29480 [Saccharothrix violaceirubra]|uniref:Nitrate reductase delta subunit n=1 Tax=Saccharothrix violaceirubra TaxID=413306 RepID=A0A7W7WWY3_9PSEU|nr:nitrate reductase molybdenum cofactor assembly chaperone [Saccharothrix violaceirubra]MBB4966571.1 nitrate reductase delta subunit [Saccharothrix violaceirubra]
MTETAWQVQSLLLGYPDAHLLGLRPVLRESVATLPAPLGTPLEVFLNHVDATSPTELAASYVATFDHRKRFSPYLTYFVHGDTRKRGMALLRFKNTYRAAGLVLDEGELPDHVSVVLEFAAISPTGRTLLEEHRAGLELLRLGLREASSPWAPVLDSVSATLSPLRGLDRETIAGLAAQGPPEEEVGLTPYLMPREGAR